MIVLDTNVISALMRSPAEGEVVTWLDNQPSESIWTSTVTVFEITYGLACLPDGKRKSRLLESFDRALREELEGRMLAFDVEAARAAGSIAAALRSRGQTIDMRDAQIAGIVSARRATLATRNVKHFADTGISLVDPWASASR